jgi:hypothetical protein
MIKNQSFKFLNMKKLSLILLLLITAISANVIAQTAPTVTTLSQYGFSVTNISNTDALSGGIIVNNGGSEITAKGVVWSTSSSPTVVLTTKTNQGSGTNSPNSANNFYSYISGLTMNTTYYLRAYATNAYGTAYGTEVTFKTFDHAPLGVGQCYQGGIIAHILTPVDPGYTAGFTKGIIVSVSDQGNYAWGCSGTTTGATSSLLGGGQSNTTAAVNACTELNTAAKICDNLIMNGYSDWYLPSIGDMVKLRTGLYLSNSGLFLGNFTTGSSYFTSTETSSTSAAEFYISSGANGGISKSLLFPVRAIRSFSQPLKPLRFTAKFGANAYDACHNGSTVQIYAADLGICGCNYPNQSCWPCLTTAQNIYLDSNLTTIVPNGYYSVLQPEYQVSSIWLISGGKPQSASHTQCPQQIIITTKSVTNIGNQNAVSGGEVSLTGSPNYGTPTVISKGVVWSTTTNPTIALNTKTVITGSDTTKFISYISNLLPNTTYHIKAYVNTSIGVVYGSLHTFTTLNNVPLAVGQAHQGGIIAYLLQPGDIGYDAVNVKGIIAVPQLIVNALRWHNGSSIQIGNTLTTLGSGLSNTASIINAQGSGSYAAKFCDDFEYEGYKDWFLPSKDELNKVYQNKAQLLCASCTQVYWSSSEDGNLNVWRQGFNGGTQNSGTKENTHQVLAIRAITKPSDTISLKFSSDTITFPSQTTIAINSNAVNTKNIIAYNFKLNYNSTKFKFDSVSTINTASAGGTLQVNSAVNGSVNLGWARTTKLTGTQPIINLYFTPIDSGKANFTLSNAYLNADSVTALSSKSIITKYNFGDIDLNKKILAYDAALALQYSVGMDPLPTIDPLPWEPWRIKIASVDTTVDVNANDASLILKYSVGIITKFPKRGMSSAPGYVTVNLENNELVVRSFEDMGGLNITFLDHLSDLGAPTYVHNTNALSAFNKQANMYKIGVAFSEAPVNGTVILRIPYTGLGNQTLNMELVENTAARNYQLSVLTGINDIKNSNIKIYPNPTNNIIYIEGLDNNKSNTIQIFDVQGKLVLTKTINEKGTIDLSELNKGVYVIKVGEVAQRIVKM